MFWWIRVAQSLVYCVVLCRSLFVQLPFSVWPFYCLSFDLQLPITPLISSGHFIVCPLTYSFLLPFDIFWPLYCLSFDLQLPITLWYLLAIVLSVLWFTAFYYPLISSGHCFVCPLNYSFISPFDIFKVCLITMMWFR